MGVIRADGLTPRLPLMEVRGKNPLSLDRPFPWAVVFFFGDLELSMNLWTVIAGISGFDDD